MTRFSVYTQPPNLPIQCELKRIESKRIEVKKLKLNSKKSSATIRQRTKYFLRH